MTHFWLRSETRPNEARAALTPEGASALTGAGHSLTVEIDAHRTFGADLYRAAGAALVPAGSWRDAPASAVILGLKELPQGDTTPLVHRHIMFGHAYKGQHSGAALLRRFRDGGGMLLDLEYLTDVSGRRVAAFGYWAGFAGAAVTVLAWAAQQGGGRIGPVAAWPDAAAMQDATHRALAGARPSALIVGARGRVGAGVVDLLSALGLAPTLWDKEDTAGGGPFAEILAQAMFFNCILARPDTPVFVLPEAIAQPRRLTAIGDIACDPDSDYNPVPLYAEATSWADPVLRVADQPILDVMAIDNLPSLLPRESTEDFSGQLLPHLMAFETDPDGIWARAGALYRDTARG